MHILRGVHEQPRRIHCYILAARLRPPSSVTSGHVQSPTTIEQIISLQSYYLAQCVNETSSTSGATVCRKDNVTLTFRACGVPGYNDTGLINLMKFDFLSHLRIMIIVISVVVFFRHVCIFLTFLVINKALYN